MIVCVDKSGQSPCDCCKRQQWDPDLEAHLVRLFAFKKLGPDAIPTFLDFTFHELFEYMSKKPFLNQLWAYQVYEYKTRDTTKPWRGHSIGSLTALDPTPSGPVFAIPEAYNTPSLGDGKVEVYLSQNQKFKDLS